MLVYFRLGCLLGFLTEITMLEAIVMLEKVREDSTGFTKSHFNLGFGACDKANYKDSL